jgi:hypothetical protein
MYSSFLLNEFKEIKRQFLLVVGTNCYQTTHQNNNDIKLRKSKNFERQVVCVVFVLFDIHSEHACTSLLIYKKENENENVVKRKEKKKFSKRVVK